MPAGISCIWPSPNLASCAPAGRPRPLPHYGFSSSIVSTEELLTLVPDSMVYPVCTTWPQLSLSYAFSKVVCVQCYHHSGACHQSASLPAWMRVVVCRLVMNKENQQPKGTAFVEYWDTSAAQAAAAACQKARYCLSATLAFT